MLKITNLLGQTLELLPTTSTPVERNNALFSADDKFIEDVTLPGYAGLTENNKLFIKNGHLVEALNEVYEQPVQVFVADYQFYQALFSYKIVNNQIEYILKVNLGEVLSKMKTAILSDIYTLDPLVISPVVGAFEVYMKDTCVNPQNYPCAFFPVRNEGWNPSPTDRNWLNEWDPVTQKFRDTKPGDNMTDIGIAPFYKLTYIFKKVFEYLKLNITGDLINNPEFNEIYIYTRKSVLLHNMESSLMYMPRVTVLDFLKLMKNRFKISFAFDLMTGTVTMESPQTVLSSPECIDISNYIESIQEKSVAEQKGYRVTLMVDDSDEAANIGTEENPVFEPPFALVVGNGENKVELEIGTLNQVVEDDFGYPIANQVFNNSFETGEIDDWQIRLLRFKGMKPVAGGKVFPQAYSIQLDESDSLFYRFLNDSKKVIINAKIPPGVLAKMKPSIKIQGSDKGSFFYALPEKISYSMGSKSTERISVKIEARTIVSNYKTKFFIDDNTPGDIENPNVFKYKAFWLPEIHGFSELKVQAFALGGTLDTFGYTPIDMPTDDGGIGGTIGTVYRIFSGPRADRNWEIRVYSPVPPQYFVRNGIKGYFTAANGYYIFQGDGTSSSLGKPVWIVF